MYYINERDIEVVMPNGESIYIDNNSKFYDYIRRLILSEQKSRVIREKIQDNMGNYTIQDYTDLINSMQAIRDRAMHLIERRALTYRRLGSNYELLTAIEDGDRDDSFEDFRLQDEILENEMNLLDEFSTDSNPVITFAKIEDTQRVISNLEGSIINFEKEVGILPSRQDKTPGSISKQVLERHQVSPESFAYAPISRGIERDVLIGEAINTAIFHFDGQTGASDVVSGLQRISNRSRRISQSRYEHHEMYRGTGITMPETLRGTNGDNFYDRISPLDKKTIDGCGQIIRYSIDGNMPAVKSMTKQIDSDLCRISNFEEALVDVGRTSEEVNSSHDRARRYIPNRKQNSARRLLEKLNKKALAIGVGIAFGASAMITGVNMAATLNDVSLEPEIKDVTTGYMEVIDMPTDLQEASPYIVDENELTTSQVVITPENTTPKANVVNVSPAKKQERKGPLQSLVENMSDDEVAKYATAFREGNDNIKYFRDAYVIANWGKYETDREFLEEAFKECDIRINMVHYYGDSHQLAYQMIELMDVLIKSEIEEALDEKGMDVDMEDVSFYVTYTSGDKVNAYDIRLGEGEDMKVLARSVHVKGTSLDTAIRSRYELERAAGKVATFDPNTIMAEATQNCYRIFEAYVSGNLDLIKNGDISDIRRENSKGFREVKGDSLEYEEDR